MQRPGVQSISPIFRGFGAAVRVTPPRFAPLEDVFHPVYPHSIESTISPWSDARHSRGEKTAPGMKADGLDSEREASGIQDLLFGLPTEISDLILSHLSPTSLDAARLTCRLWRQNIMSNHWVLSRVTDLNARQPSWKQLKWGDEVTLRDLLKSLDRETILYQARDGDHIWRARFHVSDLEFAITQAKGDQNSTALFPKFKAFAYIGTKYEFMVLQLVQPPASLTNAAETNSTLIFFHFDTYGIPVYAGSAEFLANEEAIDFAEAAELKPMHSWIVKIKGNDHSKFYLIESRDAFSQFEARFSITEVDCSQAAQKLGPLGDERFASAAFEPSVRFPQNGCSQKILAPFPGNRDASGPESGSRILTQVMYTSLHHNLYAPRYIVEHVSSGNITVTGGEQSGCCLAVLLRPYANCVFKNITAAFMVNRDGNILVAIIWKSRDEKDQRSELYLYHVPKTISCGSDSSYGKYLASHGNPETANELENYGVIGGKRVSSLADGMGGIHPLSPLWDLANTEASKKKLRSEATLGGLQFSLFKRISYILVRASFETCCIWGPAAAERESVAIHCKIFDFTLDSSRERGLGMPFPGSRCYRCCCALHDNKFRLELPSLEDLDRFRQAARDRPAKLRWSSIWPWKYKHSQRPEEPMPVVARIETEAQKEAMARETESFRERIRCMKEAGLSNFDIAELWSRGDYDRFVKPDGWRDL